jgi:hypothetical protein
MPSSDSSTQERAESRIAPPNAARPPSPVVGQLVQRRSRPAWFTTGRLVLSASHPDFAWPAGNGARSIAKVGRTGSGRSKKCTGRLLQIPPSENQLTANRRRATASTAASAGLFSCSARQRSAAFDASWLDSRL